jgi:hypothetical protein
MPKYLSSDNDPLYRFHQWQANLRILEVTQPNFSNIEAHCGIRSGLQTYHAVFALLVAVRFAAPIVSLSPGPFKKGEASLFRGGICR